MKRKRETCTSCNKDWVVDNVVDKPEIQPNADGAAVPLTVWKFDQQACRMALCEMIILEELPFSFVDREGFKNFVECLCPQFKIPSRHEIRADCVRLFLDRKATITSFFQTKGMGRVSISASCWTSINNTNFICVTAHCIDKDWILHKKIINFRQIYNQEGNELGASIISSLEEWGLKKLLCCTMDNTSANDGAIKYMKPVFERWDTSVVGGKYTHMPCAAHIINSVAADVLEEIDLSVIRVREAVKWIKASADRYKTFKVLVNFLKIDSTKSLCLDVPTKWNSTYLMLDSSLPYEEPIKLMGIARPEFMGDLNQKKYKGQFIGLPGELDWVHVRSLVNYLEKFYDLAILVSDTTYVTSHLFFKDMCDVFELINELEANEDEEISKMAVKMKMKIGKYWLEDKELNPRVNKILYIAALLDPRQKMEHVETCLRIVYGDNRATELVGEVKNSLYELFDFYKRQMTPISAPRANTSVSCRTIEPSDRQGRRRRGPCSLLRFPTNKQPDDKLEITLYFMEEQYMMTPDEDDDNFDILQWWLKDGVRFPVLSEMARDILAIPVSSVPFEFAFSTESRVLSKFRSSLTPRLVEALICSEDWLKSSSTNMFLQDEEDVSEIEEKAFGMALAAVDAGGEPEGHVKTIESVQSQTSESGI